MQGLHGVKLLIDDLSTPRPCFIGIVEKKFPFLRKRKAWIPGGDACYLTRLIAISWKLKTTVRRSHCGPFPKTGRLPRNRVSGCCTPVIPCPPPLRMKRSDSSAMNVTWRIAATEDKGTLGFFAYRPENHQSRFRQQEYRASADALKSAARTASRRGHIKPLFEFFAHTKNCAFYGPFRYSRHFGDLVNGKAVHII